MPLLVDWPAKFVTVPKSELTLVSGTRYTITVDYWWQLLREMNASEEGMPFETMYQSTAPTSATPRIVELINEFTGEFENGLYSVELINGNTNWREIEVKNQVSVGTNNTAAFIDPVFLEASLFTEGVILDTINGYAGTGQTASGGLIGTRQTPSNNLADTHSIASFRGTRKLVIINSMTLANEDLSSGYTIIGDSPFTLVTLDPSVNLLGCSVRNISVVGEMDGMNDTQDCFLEDVTAASGMFHNCAFGGTAVLNGDADFFECYSRVEGGGYPVFTAGAHNIVARNYRGSFGLDGATTGHLSSIGVQGGRLVVEPTSIGGEVHARGEPFEIVDNSGPGCNVIDETTLAATWDVQVANHLAAGSFGKEVSHISYMNHAVYVNTEALVNGDGSVHSPFDNITDAIDFAEADGILELVVLADIVIDRQVKNFVITGIGTPVVDTNGQNMDKSEIIHCTVTGTYTGRLTAQECNIVGTFTINGFFENCATSANMVLPDGGVAYVKDCSALVTGMTLPVFDIGGVAGTADLVVTGYDGGAKFINVNQATDSAKIVMNVGRVALDASCSDGTINVGGITHLEDNSTGSTVFDETLDPHYLNEMWKISGLDSTNPMTVTPNSRISGDIDLVITGDGSTTSTVTRQ